MKYEIGFFELAFLAEACIPPVPIARYCFWMELIDKYYFQMDDGHRKQFFEWINRNDKFDLDNSECRLFYDRYNPDNQYGVTDVEGGVHEVFKHGDRFWLTSTTFIPEDKIKEVHKVG